MSVYTTYCNPNVGPNIRNKNKKIVYERVSLLYNFVSLLYVSRLSELFYYSSRRDFRTFWPHY